MPQSLHLIHQGRKARGDLRKQKPQQTLAEIRRRIVLPYKPDHLNPHEIEAAIAKLNTGK